MDFYLVFFLEFQATVNSVAFCTAKKPATELTMATELTATELTVDSIKIYLVKIYLFKLLEILKLILSCGSEKQVPKNILQL